MPPALPCLAISCAEPLLAVKSTFFGLKDFNAGIQAAERAKYVNLRLSTIAEN